MNIDKDFALFYGIMLGDGCISQSGRHKFICIALNLRDDTPFLNKIIHPLLLKFTGRKISTRVREADGTIGVNFADNSLFYYLNSLGYPIGKKGDKIKIPERFYKRNLLKYICQGFFATDGSLVLTDNNGTLYPRVETCSISKPLMQQISNYLNSKGIKCNFYLAKRKGGYFNAQQQYRLQINGKINLIKFVNKIGFVNPKQQEKLRDYIKKMPVSGFEPPTTAL